MSHPIENIMHSSMQHIKSLADVNTVIGDPLVTENDTMILPVSKVSLGLIVGGGEYLAVSNCKKEKAMQELGSEYPFIGASTVGMCLTPLAFLAVQDGSVRVLPAKQENACERLIDFIPQMIHAAEKLLGGDKCRSSCAEDKACGEAGIEAGTDAQRAAKRAVSTANNAAERACTSAEKADRAADKARSAAERAYDTAIEASRAASRASALTDAAEHKNAGERRPERANGSGTDNGGKA